MPMVSACTETPASIPRDYPQQACDMEYWEESEAGKSFGFVSETDCRIDQS